MPFRIHASPHRFAIRATGFIFLVLVFFVSSATPARAAISVLDYWRMGESDPGANPGVTITNTIDSVGANNLVMSGLPVYSADVALAAATLARSSLSANFTGTSGYGLCSNAVNLVDNFGIEAWVKPGPDVTTPQILVYNGNTAFNGWGIILGSTAYAGLLGGVNVTGPASAFPNVWTHVALVRNQGTSTLYINGIAAPGSGIGDLPHPPSGNFAVGTVTQTPGSQVFNGLVDEVRVFTFSPGEFSPTNLLVNAQPLLYAVGASMLTEGPDAGTDTVTLAVTAPASIWNATANASWLHLDAANQGGSGSTNVAFRFDANLAGTRSGTLTIAGKSVTVTQAGSNYVSVIGTPLALATNLNSPAGVAVDAAGNVYIANANNGAIQKVSAANNSINTLPVSGLPHPASVAVDGVGNLYFADPTANTVTKWNVGNSQLTTLVGGLNQPWGVALDGAGNVYIAEAGANVIKKWTAATSQVTNLISTGLNFPTGVAVDVAGNLYIADFNNSAIKKWSAVTGTVTTLTTAGLDSPISVGVDGGGNVFFSDYGTGLVGKWTAWNGNVTTLASGLSFVRSVAVDASANVYIADATHGQIKKLARAYVDPTPRVESAFGGSDALAAVVPATANLNAPFTSSDQPWLTINSTSGGTLRFTFNVNQGAGRIGHLTLLGLSIPVTQSGVVFSLGTPALLEGPGAGSDSVVLAATPSSGSWTATTNSPWLHFAAPFQSGIGSERLTFSFDANPGLTRTGSVTIAGQTLTITQAGSTYVLAQPATILVPQGFNSPQGVAVDGAGNVYIADTQNQAIEKWSVADNTLTTLISSGLSGIFRIAPDAGGNIYIADTENSQVEKWSVANGTMTTLVNSGLNQPSDLAVDSAGDVYIADTKNNTIKKWTAANQSLSTLPIGGLAAPLGVAVDAAGNVYVADSGNQQVIAWNASTLNVSVPISGLNLPSGVAVDGSGNIYVADAGASVIEKWAGATGIVTTEPLPGLNSPLDVTVDGADNIFVADTGNNQIKALPRAFVDPTPRVEGASGGNDSLPTVLPVTENLTGPFAPISEEPALAITSVSNGVVNFFVPVYFPGRTADIVLLGQVVPIIQNPSIFTLSAQAITEGPTAGTDTVMVAPVPSISTWTAASGASWLHLTANNQNGAGNSTITFTFDANSGPTRSANLLIGGRSLAITQAGATYVASGAVLDLMPGAGLVSLEMAVDGNGSIYVASGAISGIEKGSEIDNVAFASTNAIFGGFNGPSSVAMDSMGNLYIADTGNNAIKEWTATNGVVTTLVSSNLNHPRGVAVDRQGNVYFSDTQNYVLKEWVAASNTVIPLITAGSAQPQGVAVDFIGNVYFSDSLTGVVKKRNTADGSLTTLISGLNFPLGVTADQSGNVYVADSNNGVIKVWTAASGTVSTLVPQGLAAPVGVVVDNAGNVYIADPGHNLIKKLPRAFVDATPRTEIAAAGSDTLPVVVPATQSLLPPLNPTNDQPWLTVNSSSNDMVNFSFAFNVAPARTGNIIVLGHPIEILQAGPKYALGMNARYEPSDLETDSVVLAVIPEAGTWTATANAPWLHLSPASQSGTGSTNLIFNFDSNPGPTRSGTLTIAGQTLTVVQAGSTYVAAPGPVTNVVLSAPAIGVAADAAGNLYYGNINLGEIDKWSPTGGVTTLVSSNANNPQAVALDGAGNVYFNDPFGLAIRKWVATNQTVVTLTTALSGVNPALAVDNQGNVYYVDQSSVWKIPAGTTNPAPVFLNGENHATGVAVDGAGNLFVANAGDNTIKRWSASNPNPTTLVASGLNNPQGITVDGAGNVYFVDAGNNAVKEWIAASNTVVTLLTGPQPGSITTDAAGNLYLATPATVSIQERARAFVDTSTRFEGLDFATDSLPVVLPSTEYLGGLASPFSDQPWLVITGVTNGIVDFLVAPATGPRTGHINLLGLSVPISQNVIISRPILTGVKNLGTGGFQFSFTNNQTTNFTVLSTTNLALPLSNWTVLGPASNAGPGLFQFTTPTATNGAQRFYRVRSP